MWISIVPAYNEASAIEQVIHTLLAAKLDLIILVANGCSDDTCGIAAHTAPPHALQIITYPEPLGFDVPRAIGAASAKRLNPSGLVFIDGDMKGDLAATLAALIRGITGGLDMALTNCYPCYSRRSDLAASVLWERSLLNRKLGLNRQLGFASPSHGPHAVSARFLERVPLWALAIPPLSLAIAATQSLKINVAAALPHDFLGSGNRGAYHADLIARTIIADCRAAMSYLDGEPLEKILATTRTGADQRAPRRLDLLEKL